MKELLILDKLLPADKTVWRWTVSAPGLTLAETSDGGVEFVDASGAVQFVVPPAVMWDSAASGTRGESFGTVDLSVAKVGADWILTTTPDRAWLEDPARVWPVSVDPTLATGPDILVGYKSDGFSTHGKVRVGNSRDNGNKFWRTIARFPFSSLAGKQIVDAQLDVWGLSEGQSNSRTGGVHYAPCHGFNCAGDFLQPLIVTDHGWTQGGNLAARYAHFTRVGDWGGSLQLLGEESGAYTYKTLNGAQLQLAWKDFPAVTGRAAPSPTESGRWPLSPTLAVNAYDPVGTGLAYFFRISENPNPEVATVWDSGWQGASSFQVPAGKLNPGRKYYWRAYVYDAYNGHLGTSTVVPGPVWSFSTNNPAPTPPRASASPAEGEVVTLLTPTFSTATVTDVEGSPVKYQFRVATGPDGKTGAVVSSGWLTTPSWTVPAGTLQDGGTYSWVVLTDDGMDKVDASWVGKFKVDQRIGASGPSPTDSAGPVSVNLANGNGSLSFTSPTVTTVGGPMGMSFAYNSLQAPNRYRGLTGSYYTVPSGSGTAGYTFTDKTPVLVRTDPAVSHRWGTVAGQAASPGPAVPEDWFMVRWDGFINVPTAGNYTFGVYSDDRSRIYLNDATVFDRWNSLTPQLLWETAPRSMSTGPMKFRAELGEGTGPAYIELWVRDPQGREFIVPSDWYTTKVDVLPDGWSGSGPIAGSAGEYVSAKVTESSVVLTDASGSVHTYTKKSEGGYTPPNGQYGVLSVTAGGLVTLTDDDGTVYTFNAQGGVVSATSPADSGKSATPISLFRPSTGVLDRIVDPLSTDGATPANYSREIRFAYTGDTGASVGLAAADVDGNGLACRVPAGFTAPPPGKLCRIIFPGHTPGADDTTQLFYDASGRLAQIEDPGAEVTSFGYNGDGRMSAIRDSLANDWLKANPAVPMTAPVATELTYTAKGQVASVTLPAPDGTTPGLRPMKTYTYPTAPAAVMTSYVDVAGLTVPTTAPSNGHAMTVTYDAAYRQLASTSALGLTASKEWNLKDQVLSTTDPWDRKSTTIYNAQDRPTDSYGPAPSSCFGADRRPLVSCSILPAHSSTNYDQGLNGLHAQYYPNPTLSGPPKEYALSLGGDGSVSKNWLAAGGTSNLPADNWSLRLSGLITFPTAGQYHLQTFSDDAVSVWIDDVRVVHENTVQAERWSQNASSLLLPVTAGQQSRIRIHYSDVSANARLELHWTPPGGTRTLVPATQLTPDYGLANSTTTDDGVQPGQTGVTDAQVPDSTTALTYTHPWLGAPTAAREDPSGLNLTTSTAYETPGTAYLRRSSKTMPSGSAATSTYSYYGDKQTLASAGLGSVCGLPDSTAQHGFLKRATGVDPDAAGPAVPIATDYVYDTLGRTVGTKRTGDSAWPCTTFDARGRVLTTTFPAYGGAPARTATSNHAAGNDPLVSYAEDGAVAGSTNGSRITTKIDLLGRTTTYTDVWGTVTTTSYEALTGRVSQIATATPGAAARTQQFVYNLDGQVTQLKAENKPIANLAYTSGELTAVSYPSGTTNAGNGSSLSSLVRDARGATTSMTWTFAAGQGTAITDSVVRSQSGRILKNVLTRGSTTFEGSYSYDAAGRLVRASVPKHQLSYAFAPSGGCGLNAEAGKNGNRTSVTDVFDGGSPTTIDYCYDHADRLTSSTVTGPTSGANPINDGLTPAELSYDAHGNTTKLADQTLAYDVADRHTTTTLTDGTVIKYVRDVSDRIVARTLTPPAGAAETLRYTFKDASDAPAGTLNTGNVRQQLILSLPGGVTVSFDGVNAGVWTYPNLHGDQIIGPNGTGALRFYDPYGQPIDPATGKIGTLTADDAVPDTHPGTADTGWVGKHQKLYEHHNTIATIEMGARQYVPALGRFLSVDPVRDANANDYNYPNDPLNAGDFSGREPRPIHNRQGSSTDHARDPGYGNPVARQFLNSTQQVQRPKPSTGNTRSRTSAPPASPPRGPTHYSSVGLSACALICAKAAWTMPKVGTPRLSLGAGAGLTLGLGVTAGGGATEGTLDAGWDTSVGCAGSYGWQGGYFQMSAGNGPHGTYEAGWAPGAKAGCDIAFMYSF